MKKFGIIEITNFKAYENMFNEMSSKGYEYKESKFLNTIHYFNETNETKEFKFILDSEDTMGNDYKDKLNGFKIFKANENNLDGFQELNMRKEIKRKIFGDIFLSIVIAALSYFNSGGIISKYFTYGILAICGFSILSNMFYYFINKNAFNNINTEIKPIDPKITNLIFLLIALSGISLGASLIKLENIYLIISSISMPIIAIIIYVNLNKIFKRKYPEKIADLLSIVLGFVIFLALGIIIFMIYHSIYIAK